jgi:hypothetical protein
MQPKIDVKAIIELFGGARELSILFRRHLQLQIPWYTIEQWANRRSLPGKHIAGLLVIADNRKLDLDLRDYVVNPKSLLK